MVVPTLALFEVHTLLTKQGVARQQLEQCLDVMRRALVVPITDARAIAASKAALAYKLAMADAVMYAIAQEHQATLWTQDVDYQGLAGVAFQAK